jgi:hypothetical protein
MAQEQPLRFTKTSDKRQAPYPVGDEGDNHEPDRENEGEPEDELEHVARFHSNAEHELLERKSGRSVLCVHRREREGVFTDLKRTAQKRNFLLEVELAKQMGS